MFSVKPTLEKWYESYLSPTFELMKSYIEGIEEQAELSVKKFEEGKKTLVVEECIEEGHERTVTTFQGLDDFSWDIDSIFKEYFPNLQRKSALLTLTGMFEHELDTLCDMYAKEHNTTVILSDISGKGLDRSTKYLEKVCGFDLFKTTSEWQNIKGIQCLRNAIVHQSGKTKDRNGRTIAPIQNHIEKIDYLSDDGKEVIIRKGYLLYVLESYKNYMKLLDQSIKKTY